jgi:CRP-like cAMP-binding protein
VRKAKRRHRPISKIKAITPETIALLTEKGQIFHGASEQTLKQVAQHGVIRSFEKGEVVYEQGQRTDNLPLFCILSGRFDAIHIWGDHHRHIASNRAGALLGDIEMLLRGEPIDQDDSGFLGLVADQTWAKVHCVSAGEVLSLWPTDFLLENDQAVGLALARSLARKILLRSGITDPKVILSKPKQVELFLRRVARDIADRGLAPGDSIAIPLSLADIAEEVECAKQTVAVALKEIAEKHQGFSHERSLIIVPKQFLAEPLEVFGGE